MAPMATNVEIFAGAPNLLLLTGAIDDPGADAVTLRVDWGDGTTGAFQFDAQTRRFYLYHVYSPGGHFQVQFTWTDDDLGITQQSLEVGVPRLRLLRGARIPWNWLS